MLYQADIEKLIQPLITNQESVTVEVLKLIARDIRDLTGVDSFSYLTLQRYLKSGNTLKQINDYINESRDAQCILLAYILDSIAQDSYNDTKYLYKYRNIEFKPFKQNEAIQEIVQNKKNKAIKSFRDMCKNPVFMIRDLKRPKVLKPTTIKDTYKTVLDEAQQSQDLSRTINQLVDSGLRFVTKDADNNTVTRRIDNELNEVVQQTVTELNQEIQQETGKQFGADGVEITVHEKPAIDHEPFQGHQLTLKEFYNLQSYQAFEDIKGNKFPAQYRALGDYNCRHFTYSIIIGVSKPIYSDEELAEIIKRNHDGYTTVTGKHMTLYECSQKQRYYERKIRRAKQRLMVFKEADDLENARKQQAIINSNTAKYKAFSEACGLKMQGERIAVKGYKRVK